MIDLLSYLKKEKLVMNEDQEIKEMYQHEEPEVQEEKQTQWFWIAEKLREMLREKENV